MKYNLEITTEQAEVISKAMEIYARLGMGQFRDALDVLPLQKAYTPKWFDALGKIGDIIKQYTIEGVDGWQSSLGIKSIEVSDLARTAWDIYQVVRNRLSFDRSAMTETIVDFSDVFKVSDIPLAVMNPVESVPIPMPELYVG